jgi:hypothetical protein
MSRFRKVFQPDEKSSTVYGGWWIEQDDEGRTHFCYENLRIRKVYRVDWTGTNNMGSNWISHFSLFFKDRFKGMSFAECILIYMSEHPDE